MTYKLYSKRDGKFTTDLPEKIDSLPAGGRQVHWKVREPPRSLGGGLLPNAFFNIESGGPCKARLEPVPILKSVFGKA